MGSFHRSSDSMLSTVNWFCIYTQFAALWSQHAHIKPQKISLNLKVCQMRCGSAMNEQWDHQKEKIFSRLSYNIPMGSVLGWFGAFQGNIWSLAPFIPVGDLQKNTKKIISPIQPNLEPWWPAVNDQIFPHRGFASAAKRVPLGEIPTGFSLVNGLDQSVTFVNILTQIEYSNISGFNLVNGLDRPDKMLSCGQLREHLWLVILMQLALSQLFISSPLYGAALEMFTFIFRRHSNNGYSLTQFPIWKSSAAFSLRERCTKKKGKKANKC